MTILKIPFGKHKKTGIFYDAGSVPNGLKCDCICIECGTALEAVQPKLPNRQSYFRHASKLNCKGGLESLFHLVAKQILKESNVLNASKGEIFSYSQCDIETPRHGKRPDAYISNGSYSLVVEIFFWHRINQSTLDTYLNNGEQVLEIDISGQRKRIFDYEELKQLILHSAPREAYSPEKPQVYQKESDGCLWWLFPLLVVVGFILWFFRRKTRFKPRWSYPRRRGRRC